MTNEELRAMSNEEYIGYLVQRVDSIYEILYPKPVEEIEDIDSLDGIVYKAKILDKYNTAMVKVGTVDKFGIVELYDIETHAPIVPCLYQPEFYYTHADKFSYTESPHRYRGMNSNIPKPVYKTFTPKNKLNQILVTNNEGTFTTGYINEKGVAVYYDQLPKNFNEEKVHNLVKPPQEIVEEKN